MSFPALIISRCSKGKRLLDDTSLMMILNNKMDCFTYVFIINVMLSPFRRILPTHKKVYI